MSQPKIPREGMPPRALLNPSCLSKYDASQAFRIDSVLTLDRSQVIEYCAVSEMDQAVREAEKKALDALDEHLAKEHLEYMKACQTKGAQFFKLFRRQLRIYRESTPARVSQEPLSVPEGAGVLDTPAGQEALGKLIKEEGWDG